jgi:hypothetical protein
LHNSPIFFAYKKNRCANCGSSVKEAIDRFGNASALFDLNHVNPKTKSPNYKNLIKRKKLSVEQLDEVDRCALMCVTCHRALHAQNLTIGVEVVIDFGDGVKFKKILDACQVLTDQREEKVTFFTDELNKILFFKLYLGSNMQGYTTVHDLEQDNLLVHLILKTKETGTFSLTTMQDQPILDVVKLDDARFKMDFNPHFPLIKFDLPITKDFGIHIRNGTLITDQGVRTGGISGSAVVFYEGLVS